MLNSCSRARLSALSISARGRHTSLLICCAISSATGQTSRGCQLAPLTCSVISSALVLGRRRCRYRYSKLLGRLKLNGMYVAIVARQAACCTSGHLKPYPMDLLRSNSKYIRLLAQGRRGSVPGTAINPIRGAGLPRRAGRPPHGTSACNAYTTSVHRIVFLLRRTPQILALCHGFLYQSHSFTFQGASRSAQGPAPPPVPPSRHRIGKP